MPLHKKLIFTGIALSVAFVGVGTVSAEDRVFEKNTAERVATTTNAAAVAARIACVGAAVATREAAVRTAMTTFTQATNAAYVTRGTALQQAYTLTTQKEVKVAAKTAWTSFNAAEKSARKAWQSARDAAWKEYRKTAVACKAPDGTGDGVHSYFEKSGD